jgi:choline dehydrogenase-like flavoprotein
VLNANLVDLRLDDGLGRVVGARFRSYAPDDPGFDVKARFFVLCTGGIENPRLLLNFNRQVPPGIGNQNDLVGRYFCEHPNFALADAVFLDPPDVMQFFAATESFMWREGVPNFRIKVEPNSGLNVKGLAKAAARDIVCGDEWLEKIVAIMKGDPLKCFVGGVNRHLAKNERLAEFNASLHIAAEQSLNPDSRVMLGEGADMFVLRTTVLDWQLTETDHRTIRTAITLFGQYLAEQNLARIQLRDWVMAEPMVFPGIGEDEVGGNHHMCTTRMSDDARTGVVDANCGVHGLDNLYIGGSSVFSTPGHINPTYTITQLALRLGMHLTSRLSA